MQIRIGTYNIQHGKWHGHFLETGEEIIDLVADAAVIRNAGLDICGLNEVRNQEQVEGLCHQAKVIAEELGYHFVFAPAIDYRGGTYGNALVSRYPILACRSCPIVVPEDEREQGVRYEDRVLLVAELVVEDKPLTVLVCHFGLHVTEMRRAIQVIRRELATVSGEAVLMGDFNLTPDSPEYATLAKLMRDSAPQGEDLLTFPSHDPQVKIDYLFTSASICATDVAVLETTQSDHRPYTATIEW